MDEERPLSAETTATVHRIAGRVRHFGEAIQQGHEMGIEPGEHTEPWTVDFQREAIALYAQVLPWSYMLGIAEGFDECAGLMVTLPVPSDIAADWTRIEEYLRSVSKVIAEQAPADCTAPHRSASEIEDTTPPILPFDKLAALVHPDGASALIAAASAVESVVDHRDSPLSELETQWLAHIVDGESMRQIAGEFGYSERSLYREFSTMFSRIGVSGRAEAIALATGNGWLDDLDGR